MADWLLVSASMFFLIGLMVVISEYDEEFVRIMDNEMTQALIIVTLISVACLAMGGVL